MLLMTFAMQRTMLGPKAPNGLWWERWTQLNLALNRKISIPRGWAKKVRVFLALQSKVQTRPDPSPKELLSATGPKNVGF